MEDSSTLPAGSPKETQPLNADVLLGPCRVCPGPARPDPPICPAPRAEQEGAGRQAAGTQAQPTAEKKCSPSPPLPLPPPPPLPSSSVVLRLKFGGGRPRAAAVRALCGIEDAWRLSTQACRLLGRASHNTSRTQVAESWLRPRCTGRGRRGGPRASTKHRRLERMSCRAARGRLRGGSCWIRATIAWPLHRLHSQALHTLLAEILLRLSERRGFAKGESARKKADQPKLKPRRLRGWAYSRRGSIITLKGD